MNRQDLMPPAARLIAFLWLFGAALVLFGCCTTVPVKVSVLLDASGKQLTQTVPAGEESVVVIDVQAGAAADRLELRYEFLDQVAQPFRLTHESAKADRKTLGKGRVRFAIPSSQKRFVVYNLWEGKCLNLEKDKYEKMKKELNSAKEAKQKLESELKKLAETDTALKGLSKLIKQSEAVIERIDSELKDYVGVGEVPSVAEVKRLHEERGPVAESAQPEGGL